MKTIFSKPIVLTLAVASSLFLAGCKANMSSTSTNLDTQPAQTEVDYGTTNGTPEPTLPTQDVSKSTDLNTIDAEIQNTNIIEENFSDL